MNLLHGWKLLINHFVVMPHHRGVRDPDTYLDALTRTERQGKRFTGIYANIPGQERHKFTQLTGVHECPTTMLLLDEVDAYSLVREIDRCLLPLLVIEVRPHVPSECGIIDRFVACVAK